MTSGHLSNDEWRIEESAEESFVNRQSTKEEQMRSRIWLALIAVALLASSAAFSQSIDAAAIDALMQDGLKAWQVPGASVAVVRGDEVVYIKGFGVKELGGSKP